MKLECACPLFAGKMNDGAYMSCDQTPLMSTQMAIQLERALSTILVKLKPRRETTL